MEEKTLNFYRRCIFGAKYKKTNLSKKDIIINYCFNNAWQDMASHTFTVKIEKAENNNKTYKEKHDDEIKKLKEEFKKSVFEKYFFNEKATIRNKIKEISQEKRKNDSLGLSIQLTIGQSQKVVNMFYKYLYTFQDLNLKFIKSIKFSECDCPIDNINLKRIKEWINENLKNEKTEIAKKLKKHSGTYTYNENSWSKIDNIDDYIAIQDFIDFIIEKEKDKYQSRLDYDFDWE